MKLRSILALSTLCVIVKGAWWAAAVQPVILSLGAVLSAIDLDVLDIQMPFLNKQEEDDDELHRKSKFPRFEDLPPPTEK